MMLPRLYQQEEKKVLIGGNLSSHLNESVIEAYLKHDIAFISLFPKTGRNLQKD